jgi:hypothetical protein
VWADCAKGIDPAKQFSYTAKGKFAECALFESPTEIELMRAFVMRTEAACQGRVREPACHKRFHYTDVALQHRHYDRRWQGTRDDDVVAVTVAAIHYVRNGAVESAVPFASSREALFMLSHCVGDLHQPLHVAAVYLTATGGRLNPDIVAGDVEGGTAGGNRLLLPPPALNLHRLWDEIPTSWRYESNGAAWLEKARAIPLLQGRPESWPAQWADSTLAAGRTAFRGLRFEPRIDGHWQVRLPPGYQSETLRLQRRQLIEAAGHLAAVLRALWP